VFGPDLATAEVEVSKRYIGRSTSATAAVSLAAV